MSVSPSAKIELQFLSDNIEKANEAKVGTLPEYSGVVYSDASNTGYGGYVVELGKDKAQGAWDSSQSMKSSTWK